jgi:hypothetical protein
MERKLGVSFHDVDIYVMIVRADLSPGCVVLKGLMAASMETWNAGIVVPREYFPMLLSNVTTTGSFY